MGSTIFEFAADVHVVAKPPVSSSELERLAAEAGAVGASATGDPAQSGILHFRAWADVETDDEGAFMEPFVQQAVPAAAERLRLPIQVEDLRVYAVCVACRQEADGVIRVHATRTRADAGDRVVIDYFDQLVWTCGRCRERLEGGQLHLAYCPADKTWGTRGDRCPAGCGRRLAGEIWPA